jgi:hypothetical protein
MFIDAMERFVKKTVVEDKCSDVKHNRVLMLFDIPRFHYLPPEKLTEWQKLGVYFYALPPNSTSWSQPLDMPAVFGNLKHWFRRELARAICGHHGAVSELTVVKALSLACVKFLKPKLATAAFKQAGLGRHPTKRDPEHHNTFVPDTNAQDALIRKLALDFPKYADVYRSVADGPADFATLLIKSEQAKDAQAPTAHAARQQSRLTRLYALLAECENDSDFQELLQAIIDGSAEARDKRVAIKLKEIQSQSKKKIRIKCGQMLSAGQFEGQERRNRMYDETIEQLLKDGVAVKAAIKKLQTRVNSMGKAAAVPSLQRTWRSLGKTPLTKKFNAINRALIEQRDFLACIEANQGDWEEQYAALVQEHKEIKLDFAVCRREQELGDKKELASTVTLFAVLEKSVKSVGVSLTSGLEATTASLTQSIAKATRDITSIKTKMPDIKVYKPKKESKRLVGLKRKADELDEDEGDDDDNDAAVAAPRPPKRSARLSTATTKQRVCRCC